MNTPILAVPAILLAIAATVTQPASARQTVCGARAALIDQLDQNYGEQALGVGIADPVTIFELFASERTGTWTILRTQASGVSCVMVTGEVWEQFAPAPKGNVRWTPASLGDFPVLEDSVP